ncbi:MAG: PPC domain-containing DNA-binding protein [Nanoarchaeota archaeon]
MKTFAFRLHPEQDLKKELVSVCAEKNIQSGFILTCAGSLKRATLRLANENIVKDFEQKFEIVSLVGTLCQEGVHLHISISDDEGNTFGGHIQEGCIIYTTAEIVIGELEDVVFSRKPDAQTGFKELVISS